jgi:hypothetical protein
MLLFEQKNEATDYIDKLAGALKRDPESIGKLNQKKIERIAQILTGLYVASNEKFRKTLKIPDSKFETVITGLKSTPGAATFTAEIGKRLPSMLSQHKEAIQSFSKMDQQQKEQYISKLETLYKTVAGGQLQK